MNLKNYLLLAAFATVPVITLMSYPQGAPVNRTGSPASMSMNCTSCHNPVTSTDETILITTTIPSTGFVANTDYLITISGTSANTPRMGFAASVEQGGFFAGNVYPMTGNQKVGDNITHINTSISTSNGQISWTFRWNSGNATSGALIYTAVLFANGNGNNNGDRTKTAQLVLTKSTIGLEENNITAAEFTPNPASALTRIVLPISKVDRSITIVDVSGRIVSIVAMPAGETTAFINVENWSNGTYLVRSSGIFGSLVVNH